MPTTVTTPTTTAMMAVFTMSCHNSTEQDPHGRNKQPNHQYITPHDSDGVPNQWGKLSLPLLIFLTPCSHSARTQHGTINELHPSWIEAPISADTTDEPIMSAYIELSRAGEHNRNNGDAIMVVKIRALLMNLTRCCLSHSILHFFRSFWSSSLLAYPHLHRQIH